MAWTDTWSTRAKFKADALAVCQKVLEVPFNSREGKCARFLLALMPCDGDWREIQQLTGLCEPTVKKYRQRWWVVLCEKGDTFRYDWFKDDGGSICFLLDVLVLVGKLTRHWDEEAKDFMYALENKQVEQAEVKPEPEADKQIDEDKHVVEIKYSARREGLVPMVEGGGDA